MTHPEKCRFLGFLETSFSYTINLHSDGIYPRNVILNFISWSPALGYINLAGTNFHTLISNIKNSLCILA